MIKVENGIATREPIPDFLLFELGSLSDFSGTPAEFGFQDSAWWPEENTEGELGPTRSEGRGAYHRCCAQGGEDCPQAGRHDSGREVDAGCVDPNPDRCRVRAGRSSQAYSHCCA